MAEVEPLASALTDVRISYGWEACYKAPDAVTRAKMPAALGQHRCGYCLAIKKDPERLAQCIREDDSLAAEARSSTPSRTNKAEDPRAVSLRTCSFGVTEVVVPLEAGGQFAGWLYLGSSRQSDQAPIRDHQEEYNALPSFDEQRWLAMGRVVQRAFQHVLEHHGLLKLQNKPGLDERIAKALRLIAREQRVDIRVRRIARAVGLSESRFVHLFNEKTGMRVSEVVRETALQHAASLLVESDKKVLEIAMDLGFANQNHFANAFRQKFGCTATEFRKRAQFTSEARQPR